MLQGKRAVMIDERMRTKLKLCDLVFLDALLANLMVTGAVMMRATWE
jgi:hypothetical protein